MITPLVWPAAVLTPAQILANGAPFSRSGGKSLGGSERVTRTDRGSWKIAYKGIMLGTPERRRTWNAIRTRLSGMAETIAVPVWSFDSAPWAAGTEGTFGRTLSPFSDGGSFSDGGRWATAGLAVEMATAAAIGATSVSLTLVTGLDDLSGIRFSWNHALYETGPVTLVAGAVWTVPVFPAIRAAIPAGAALDLDLPTCLVRLASDSAMDGALSAGDNDKVDVGFVEAVDVWNDEALAAVE